MILVEIERKMRKERMTEELAVTRQQLKLVDA